MVRVGWSDLKSIGLNQFENLGLYAWGAHSKSGYLVIIIV